MALVIVTPKTPTDYLRIAEIRAQAFGSDYEYISLLFSLLTTLEGQILLRNRLISMAKAIPSTRFATVRDSETDEVVV